jgi:hypothetical protein
MQQQDRKRAVLVYGVRVPNPHHFYDIISLLKLFDNVPLLTH